MEGLKIKKKISFIIIFFLLISILTGCWNQIGGSTIYREVTEEILVEYSVEEIPGKGIQVEGNIFNKSDVNIMSGELIISSPGTYESVFFSLEKGGNRNFYIILLDEIQTARVSVDLIPGTTSFYRKLSKNFL